MDHTYRRKPVTLTVREDVLQAAKALSLNTSQAAEAGIRDAVREALTDKWLADNAAAISAYNADLEARGPAIPVLWAKR
ncbi:MAG: type II toxin-antitoxin system CcdA family antitoxin [Hyphomicrobiaceae bacterium]|nr:type II toxin-antitoxin system CcdA family antitoxin [Hyphomicrobiaceae bacterium]